MFACLALFVGWADPELTFEKDVRPIIKQHCFHCHGEEPKPKGDLDLRTVKVMRKGGQSGPAIQPGHLDTSEIWERVSTDVMPEGSKKMPAYQKAILKKWIEQGAKTARPEPDEQLEPVVVRLDEAIRMCLDGTIRDAKTITSLLLWEKMQHGEPGA